MSKKGFKKRLFVSIFSFYFIIFQFFMVPSAMAFPNFDLFGAGWDPIQKILELIKEAGQGAMKTSISTALSYFLQTMAKDVAQGIVSGSTGQEPLFRVETFTTSLKNAADNATGVFLDDLSERGFDTLGLCKPVSVQSISSAEGDLTKWLADVMKDLTDSLNLIPDFGEYDLTSRTPTCTVSKVIETMQDNIDYILGSYFEYLFLDVFKKNCNISEIERFENDFSKAVTSLMGFFSVLDPFSIIPEAEDLAGALESLEKEYDFQCSFFVCEDGNTNYNCENINWEKTSEKMISETIYPVIVNSLQLAFGEYDIVETPEQTLEFQVARSCYEMADVIDDNILLSMADPKNLSDSIDDLTNTYNINLFNNVVSVMNPYYIHSDINYLDHFKKCVYLANKGETGPSFIEADSDSVKEENCWLGIYKNNNNIEYNGKVIPKINITEEYKKEIKDSLTENCIDLSYEKIAFFPEIARREYNENLEKIRKYNEEQRKTAEAEVTATTPNEEISGTTDQISGDKTGTSTQTTQMVEGYQNSLQSFLTPTGDVWLDAGKLFLATLLEGYFEELKKGIFQLPENFAFNDFENFGNEFLDQFDDVSDWFGTDDWGEALLQDLVGTPETTSIVGQPCIMDANCESGICDYVGSDKICIECSNENYTCSGEEVCHNNECVECVSDSDCESPNICNTEFECVLPE